MSGLEVMIELGISFSEGIAGELDESLEKKLKGVFKDFLTEKTDFAICCSKVTELIGKDEPVRKIREIMELPEEPLPFRDDGDSEEGGQNGARKKTRTWTIAEDQRLLAGIFHYGLDNWQNVAQFLGSGRNRAQCSQRWMRGLNPKISKKSWTAEEDDRLEELVRVHGLKSWTKIAAIIGNRSDVQCRYHYKQIITAKKDTKPVTSDDHPLSLSRGSKLTMSSSFMLLKPESIISESPTPIGIMNSDSSVERIPLASSNFSGSMPLFRLNKNNFPGTSSILRPIPIVPRRTSKDTEPSFLAESSNWGRCGSEKDDLNGFLSNFM